MQDNQYSHKIEKAKDGHHGVSDKQPPSSCLLLCLQNESPRLDVVKNHTPNNDQNKKDTHCNLPPFEDHCCHMWETLDQKLGMSMTCLHMAHTLRDTHLTHQDRQDCIGRRRRT
eukprot:gnl/MRDRNA2_/MRDRNA2_373428_c0_seq1.p2 gnl/MRDRNA2_/MRDRNA2_373428_c0~~gnl/MRDRNA2_/MRDRNA2_373428_c0_seq1.p2  ORF type:complete len:114 (-),score=16.01 gnl/MRDRNA2_/MRDRNA2_373428_c0_seq1:88-429(-)